MDFHGLIMWWYLIHFGGCPRVDNMLHLSQTNNYFHLGLNLNNYEIVFIIH